MSEYENRIFAMLTSNEEKLKSALEIAKHINGIKKQLITQFWKNVEKELYTLIQVSNEEFKVKLDADIFHPNSKCSLYLQNDTKARLIFEHLSNDQCMGLWFQNQLFDMSKINAYRNQFQNDITYFSNHTWWLAFKEMNENFNNFDSLVMILPNNSIEYSKEKAQELFDFAVENKEHLKYVINNCLK